MNFFPSWVVNPCSGKDSIENYCNFSLSFSFLPLRSVSSNKHQSKSLLRVAGQTLNGHHQPQSNDWQNSLKRKKEIRAASLSSLLYKNDHSELGSSSIIRLVFHLIHCSSLTDPFHLHNDVTWIFIGSKVNHFNAWWEMIINTQLGCVQLLMKYKIASWCDLLQTFSSLVSHLIDIVIDYSSLSRHASKSPTPTSFATTLRWNSELALLPNEIVVKSCSCGNQIHFDPLEELSKSGLLGALSTSLSTLQDHDDSDYGSFDRRCGGSESRPGAGIFYAKPVEVKPKCMYTNVPSDDFAFFLRSVMMTATTGVGVLPQGLRHQWITWTVAVATTASFTPCHERNLSIPWLRARRLPFPAFRDLSPFSCQLPLLGCKHEEQPTSRESINK